MIHPTDTGTQTARMAFILDPDDRVRLILTYPASTGRNFREILRALDSIQFAERYGIATPANWERGQDVLLPATMSSGEARARFPEGFVTRKPYVRVIPQPGR